MRRDQCNLSAEVVSVYTAQALARFRGELRLLARLEAEGHSRECAEFMVWGEENGLIRSCCRCGVKDG